LLLAELVFDHAGEQRRVALGFEQFGLQGVDAPLYFANLPLRTA